MISFNIDSKDLYNLLKIKKVSCIISSDFNATEIIELVNKDRQVFQRGSIDSFLLVLEKYLILFIFSNKFKRNQKTPNFIFSLITLSFPVITLNDKGTVF